MGYAAMLFTAEKRRIYQLKAFENTVILEKVQSIHLLLKVHFKNMC